MKKLFAMLLVMVLLVCSSSVFAEEDTGLNDVLKKGELVMGFDEGYPPMGFKQDGEYVGFDIDLAGEVCKRLGVDLVLQPIAWDSKEMELNGKKIDCIWSGMTITADRQQQMLFSMPYLKNQQILIVRADSGIISMADLDGKVLGTQAGSASIDVLNGNEELQAMVGEPMLYDDFVTALMDLKLGGIDVLLIDSVVGNYSIGQMENADDLLVLPEVLQAEEYGIGFRLGDESLVNAVNQQLIAIESDGTLAEISAKWFAEDMTVIAQYAADYAE